MTALPSPPANPAPFGPSELEALVETTLRDLRSGQPGLPAVGAASSLDRDLGFDSLARIELLLRIEAAAGVALPEDTLQRAETVADLWEAVRCGRARAAPVQDRAVAAPAPSQAPAGAAGDLRPWEAATTLLEVLDAHRAVHPDRVQLVHLDETIETPLTYRALSEGAAAVAAALQRAGLRPRQTVALMLPTSPDYFPTYLGILRAGGIPVPIYPPARPSQLEDHVRRHTGILTNAGVVLLVSVPQMMSVARLLQARVPGLRAVLTPEQLRAAGGEPLPVTVRPDDIAFIQYTSGSTGQPKGVALTHANLLANIRAMAEAIEATQDDVFVSWLPLYHDMGLIGAWLGSFTVGFRLVVMSPLAFLGRPRRWLETISRHRGTLSAGPNFAYELCLTRIDDTALAGLDLSSWRLAFNGAEAVSPDTVTRFGQRFAACGLDPRALTPVYGLAEAAVGLLFPPLHRGPRIDAIQRDTFERERRAIAAAPDDTGALRVVACGRALPGHAVRIVDEAGEPVPERVEGRLEFSGPSATPGYWHAPELTALLYRDGDGDGPWLDTGDRAYRAEGDVFVTGRVKDIVIRAGRNLYPQEIEEAVGAVPGIRKGCVAVFGLPDRRSGTERLVVLAEVSAGRAGTGEGLREAVAGAVVDAIGEPADEIVLAPPHTVLKTSSGKVRRSACRELVARGRVGAAAAGTKRQWLRLAGGAVGLRARAALGAVSSGLFGLRATLVFWLLAPLAWGITVLLPSTPSAWRFCHLGARALLRGAGVRLTVQGVESMQTDGACVLVCNHASYLDGVVLVASLPRPCTFVAKRELAGQFVAGRFLRRIGAEFVERFAPERSVADARRLAQAAAAGRTLLVFPEGTFRAAPGLLPFHLGAFLAAAQAKLPVRPLTIGGTRRMLGAGRWWPRPATLTLQVGAPIRPAADLPAFAAAVRMRDRARAAIARSLATDET